MFLLLVYLFVAIGFSFYCSVAEATLLSITPSFTLTLRKKRPAAADRLTKLKDHIDRPLSAILSLNTIAHTIGAAGVGAQAAKLYGSEYVGIASAVMTLLILIFSEIIPKTIGALYWRSLAPVMATTVDWLILVLYPLVWLSELLTKVLSGGKSSHAVTREELAAMADIGGEQGVLADHEVRIYRSLLRLLDLTTRDIMTPRVVVIALQQARTVGDVFGELTEIPVSRLPLYFEKLDDVVGFVLKTDLLLAHAEGESDAVVGDFKRDIITVRDDRPLPELLDRLLTSRQHIAMVVDQYGTMVGLVTLEDLTETLLGTEIVDESDNQVDMQSFARKRWKQRAEQRGLPASDKTSGDV